MVSTLLTAVLALTGCTGGQESTAAEETAPKANSIDAPQAEQGNAREVLGSINPAIPVYAAFSCEVRAATEGSSLPMAVKYAAAIWRQIEPSREEIATRGLKFIRRTLA